MLTRFQYVRSEIPLMDASCFLESDGGGNLESHVVGVHGVHFTIVDADPDIPAIGAGERACR